MHRLEQERTITNIRVFGNDRFCRRRSTSCHCIKYVADLADNSHLRTSVHVHVPLVVPRGPLRHLGTSQNPHDVGRTVADEACLACAVGVGSVETPLIDGHFLEEDQRGPERFPATR